MPGPNSHEFGYGAQLGHVDNIWTREAVRVPCPRLCVGMASLVRSMPTQSRGHGTQKNVPEYLLSKFCLPRHCPHDLSVWRQRCRPRGRSALARADILGAPALVLFRRQQFQFDSAASGGVLMQLLQEWYAPTAAGSRAPALGELARHARPRTAYEVHELAPRDVKTVADLVVEIHLIELVEADAAGCSLLIDSSVS